MFPGLNQTDGDIELTHKSEGIRAVMKLPTTRQKIFWQNCKDRSRLERKHSQLSKCYVLQVSSLDATGSEKKLACLHHLSIGPLKSNKLDQTKELVLGLHTPYAYRSLAKWAPFHMHRGDFDLFYLNYLYIRENI